MKIIILPIRINKNKQIKTLTAYSAIKSLIILDVANYEVYINSEWEIFNNFIANLTSTFYTLIYRKSTYLEFEPK